MKKNKLLKIMISSVVSIMLFTNTAFTVFAADSSSAPTPPAPLNSNGSWTNIDTVIEEGATTSDPNLGKNKDFGANNIDPTDETNNWVEEERQKETITAKLEGLINTHLSGASGKEEGSGNSYDHPHKMYYGDSGYAYESRFSNFCNTVENGSEEFAAGSEYRDSYPIYNGEDEEGNIKWKTVFQRVLWAKVVATKTTNKQEASHKTIDYWKWIVQYAVKEGDPLTTLYEGMTATSGLSYTPDRTGYYVVTSIPHQHEVIDCWDSFYAKEVATFSDGTSKVIGEKSGTTPVTQRQGTDVYREDKKKTESFTIAPGSNIIIKDYWQWTDVKIDKSEAEYETELIN